MNTSYDGSPSIRPFRPSNVTIEAIVFNKDACTTCLDLVSDVGHIHVILDEDGIASEKALICVKHIVFDHNLRLGFKSEIHALDVDSSPLDTNVVSELVVSEDYGSSIP